MIASMPLGQWSDCRRISEITLKGMGNFCSCQNLLVPKHIKSKKVWIMCMILGMHWVKSVKFLSMFLSLNSVLNFLYYFFLVLDVGFRGQCFINLALNTVPRKQCWWCPWLQLLFCRQVSVVLVLGAIVESAFGNSMSILRSWCNTVKLIESLL